MARFAGLRDCIQPRRASDAQRQSRARRADQERLSRLELDHIQLAAPEGCELAAREFYGAILGLKELEKPAALKARGGCWFECGRHQIHIGVEHDFRPAKKAHPAFNVDALDQLRSKLIAHGFGVEADDSIPDVRRFFTADPWGNRLEFIER